MHDYTPPRRATVTTITSNDIHNFIFSSVSFVIPLWSARRPQVHTQENSLIKLHNRNHCLTLRSIVTHLSENCTNTTTQKPTSTTTAYGNHKEFLWFPSTQIDISSFHKWLVLQCCTLNPVPCLQWSVYAVSATSNRPLWRRCSLCKT